MIRAFLDRAIGRLAQVLVLSFHRRVDVVHRERLQIDGPTIIVANHGNGFVDPAVVAAALRRVPRFVGKATLFDVWIARPFLALAGVIPVYRRADGDTAANASTFRAIHAVLASGGTVAIFPEGTSSDRPSLEKVRTGAARMALGALGTVDDVTIIPIGLSFESHVDIRPAVAVFVGEPISVDGWRRETGRDGAGEEDRDAVLALTERIRKRLAAVSPDFDTLDERLILRAAAEVTARDAGTRLDPTFGTVELLARHLAEASADDRAAVVASYRDYATRLSLIGLRDSDLENRNQIRRLARPAVAGGVLFLIGPLLLALAVIHLPAIALVLATTSAARNPVNKGTTRLLVGLVAGLVTWAVTGVVLADGTWAWATALAVAVGGAVALATIAPLYTLLRLVIGRARTFGRRQLAEDSREDREILVRTVVDVAGPPIEGLH
ncbi:1-acyl-sn-glycerol-3-phosphate acyltransferase [Actinospongicola halichondriae]|uniref:1-acyl-sn-glycerol-3-phosphate acyltransferase n=1 Tax=Actinospongicola halichondriae TaxID=3236844 RepID=UPI003D4D5579